MKLFLDLAQVTRQPRRWAALLSTKAGPTPSNRAAEMALVLNHLAQQFVAARRVIVQRRAPGDFRERERFLLRPAASAEPVGNGKTWLGLVCDFDPRHRALCVMDRIAVQPAPLLPFERVFVGEISLESRPLAPAYCDGEAVAFLNKLPLAAESEPAPTDRWRDYLDWRQKLAKTKAAESQAYSSWEKRTGRTARFFLRDAVVVDKLRQSLLDEEMRAGQDARDVRAPQGVFRRIVVPHGTTRHAAIDIEFDAATWETLTLSPQGELHVAMEGELATLEIQTNGLRRFAEQQAQNPYLSNWLFDITKARPIPDSSTVTWTPKLPLNPEQREAVARALAMDDLLLLWGPPGTGKTTVIAEICAQYAARGLRVLVASQANLAVEQALSRLPQLASVRPAWVSTARKRDSAAGDIRGGLYRWLGSVSGEAADAAQQLPENDPWAGLLAEWARRLESVSDNELSPEDEERFLRHANIIGATCNESGKPDFIGAQRFLARFDLVIVDEVSKASPPELLLAMLMGRRVLLAGDHRQLPPLFRDEAFEDAVESGEIEHEQVERFRELVTSSWFDRAFHGAPPAIKIGLCRQYRMHPAIMDAVNVFYADQPLQAGDDARVLAREKRHDLTLHGPGGHNWLRPEQSILWIDTSHDTEGRMLPDERVGSSRRNALEAEIAARIVAGIAEPCAKTNMNVGVISFYRAQADLLRDRLRREVLPDGWLHLWRDVNTVDQFQGSERDVVIVSLVRAGSRLTGEFVRDFRRINVAFSRARRLLIVLGSRAAFGSAEVTVPTAASGEATIRAYECIHEMVRRRGGALIPAAILGREMPQ
ncbi:MAG: AAA family ATPase [Verrucomicrobia bacterium]|nr:AAA family ATPase [Verrucomicrobiota bacterium]